MRSLLIALLLASPVQAGVRIVSVGPPKASRPPVAAPAPTSFPARQGYPLRGRWYSHPSGSLVTHLSTGVHAGKFDLAWLSQLEPEELESLHSDDHQGLVKWQHVVRPAVAAAKPVQRSACPGGVCPTSRPGLFGRLLGR